MVSDNAALFAEARYDGHFKDIDDGIGFSGNGSTLYSAVSPPWLDSRLGF